jgi:tetrahydromethanopterin S-methyltransferase subunit G
MSEIEENKMDTINGKLDNILVEFFETLGKKTQLN